MTISKPKSVLDEEVFPIMGWPGPSGELIRDDVMRDMAEAGFTLSFSNPSPGKRLEALDIAHRNGIRLVLGDPAYHVDDDFKLTTEKRNEIEKVVEEIKDHPGLYGYFIRDEPRAAVFPALGEVKALIHSLDPYHLKYINHYRARQTGYGAGSMELFWLDYVEKVKPEFLSYDQYVISVVSQAEIEKRDPSDPAFLPAYKMRVGRTSDSFGEGSGFFDSLEMCRYFALRFNLPFWVFTMSVRHGWYPTPTEGHTRYQLMEGLAYGARGLQYFTYSGGGLIDQKGERTEMWHIARKVNREVHAWAPLLRKLRSIGVFHTGPPWSGTMKIAPEIPKEHLTVDCVGDPVTIGFFHDPDRTLHLLIVNKSPADWARIALMVNLAEKEQIWEVNPATGEIGGIWPYNREKLELVLTPGEGRLFKISEKP